MDVAIIAIAAVAVGGTLAWLVVAVASAVVLVKMDPEARALVPNWLWVLYGLTLFSATIWPIGTVVSLVALIAGGGFAMREERARPAGLALAAVGGTYVGLILAIVAMALLTIAMG